MSLLTGNRFRITKRGPGVSDIRVFLLGATVLLGFLAGREGMTWLLFPALVLVYVCGALRIDYKGRTIWGGEGESGTQWEIGRPEEAAP